MRFLRLSHAFAWTLSLAVAALAVACGDDAETPAASGASSTSSSSGTGGGGGSGGGGEGGHECVDTGTRPSPRGEMAGVLDASRDRLVFFGGDAGFPKNCNSAPDPVGELWTFDLACGTFSQHPDAGPSPRARGGAAYDAAGDRMLMFGGRYREGSSGSYTLFDDVWSLDLEGLAFTQVQVTGAGPAARGNPAVVFDDSANELVIFGGNTSTSGLSFSPQNDLWALSLATGTWRQIAPSGAPPSERLFHAGAIDPATRTLYIYGGGGENAFQGPFYGDLWKVDLSTGAWTELHDGKGNAPDARIWSTIAFDGAKNRVLLFGGHDDGAVGNNNDTWAFDLAANAWGNITAAETVNTPSNAFCDFPADFTLPNLSAPDRRSAQLAGFSTKRGTFAIFGGKSDCGIIDDVWVFDAKADTWSKSIDATTGEACLRRDFPEQCTSLCQ